MQEQSEESTFIRHEACDNCGSSDGKAVYSNGGTYCFVCDDWGRGEDGSVTHHAPPQKNTQLWAGTSQGVRERGLSEESCRKFGYLTCDTKDGKVWAANYRNKDGLIVAQKLRTEDKKFSVVGEGKKLTFFGQHLWNKGRKLVITEGEIDTRSQVAYSIVTCWCCWS